MHSIESCLWICLWFLVCLVDARVNRTDEDSNHLFNFVFFSFIYVHLIVVWTIPMHSIELWLRIRLFSLLCLSDDRVNQTDETRSNHVVEFVFFFSSMSVWWWWDQIGDFSRLIDSSYFLCSVFILFNINDFLVQLFCLKISGWIPKELIAQCSRENRQPVEARLVFTEKWHCIPSIFSLLDI